jgi:hypothetical protein
MRFLVLQTLALDIRDTLPTEGARIHFKYFVTSANGLSMQHGPEKEEVMAWLAKEGF